MVSVQPSCGSVIYISNMFSLIRMYHRGALHRDKTFTFQYVSINTELVLVRNLNFLYLHSNMFLLIHRLDYYFPILANIFTFQYVSINTLHHIVLPLVNRHLHSNMFLLIRACVPISFSLAFIYIPICFY